MGVGHGSLADELPHLPSPGIIRREASRAGSRGHGQGSHRGNQVRPSPIDATWEHWSRRSLREAAPPPSPPAETGGGDGDGTASWIVPIFIVLCVGASPAVHACEP